MDKEINVNGIPLEKIPMKEAAIHFDDKVVKKLAYAVVFQAVQDWEKLNRGGVKRYVATAETYVLYRAEMKKFFNSTFFGDLLVVVAPNIPQELAIENLLKYPLKKQTLGRGRGKRSDCE